jgi:hypothetical protein
MRPSAAAHCKATVRRVSSTTETTPSVPSAHQTSYGWLRDMLRGAERAEVTSGPGIGTMGYRATAALNALLAAHPVDQRGRCRSCRRPGALWGRGRRTCLIYWTTRYWLLQPLEALRLRLDPELPVHVDAPSPSHTVDRDVIDALPRRAPDSEGPPGEPTQSPVVSPPLPPRRFTRVGQPDPEPGRATPPGLVPSRLVRHGPRVAR